MFRANSNTSNADRLADLAQRIRGPDIPDHRRLPVLGSGHPAIRLAARTWTGHRKLRFEDLN